MRKFIAEHVEYPAQAIERGIQGTVAVVIAVGPDGSITDSWVANEADPLLKNAALDVVRKFPKLIPTKTEGGRNVTATMRVPVTFCLTIVYVIVDILALFIRIDEPDGGYSTDDQLPEEQV